MEKLIFFPKYFSPRLKTITARLSTAEEEFHIFLVAMKVQNVPQNAMFSSLCKKELQMEYP